MKLNFIVGICFFSILTTLSVWAEYYQYVDKNGIKHFTDNISDIPADQRKQLNVYKEIKSPAPKEKKPPETISTPETEITYASLVKQKETLDKTYVALGKKKAALADQQKKLTEKEYDTLVSEFNKAVEQYETDVKSYETRVGQYNTRMKPPEQN